MGKAEVGSEIQVLLFAIIEGLFRAFVSLFREGAPVEIDEMMMLIIGGLRLGFLWQRGER